MYSAVKTINNKPQVAAYLSFYLANVNKVIKKAGYFPAPAADLKKTKQDLMDAMKGRF